MWKLFLRITEKEYTIGFADHSTALLIANAFKPAMPALLECEDNTLAADFFIKGTAFRNNSLGDGELISFVRERIEQQVVFDYSESLMLHGDCVLRNHRAACILAPSGIGKSTLTSFLCQNGFDYISDDTILFINQKPVPIRLPIEFRYTRGLEENCVMAVSQKDQYRTHEKIGIMNIQSTSEKIEKIIFLFLDKDSNLVHKMSGAKCFQRLLESLKLNNLNEKIYKSICKLVNDSEFYSFGRMSLKNSCKEICKICDE